MKRFVSRVLITSGLVVSSGLVSVAIAPPAASAARASEPNRLADTPDSAADADEQEPRGEKATSDCRTSAASLALSVDRKSVNIETGRLEARMDGPICTLTLQVQRKDGSTVDLAFRYSGPQQLLRWEPVPRDQIERIEVRVSAKDGAYESVLLIPWFVQIDHQEVKFDTNQSVIRPSEVGSLRESLAKIEDVLSQTEGKGLGAITLFIAGHTDTRGSQAHNQALSRSRAEAIATWFQNAGLCIPIAFEGFGESALKKLTADEVDEQENRRVDYILSVEPPVIKAGALPHWKMKSKGG